MGCGDNLANQLGAARKKKKLATRHSVVAVLSQLKGLEATLASSGTY
jgi:hypothetical protein